MTIHDRPDQSKIDETSNEHRPLDYHVEPVQRLHSNAGKEVHLWGTGGLLVALGFFAWIALAWGDLGHRH
ncbi:hypothetical protein [Humisphaera borealis]|uniref:Uncharacterized protein n=1 Tax=Humisphaera borealis TaxID=2807512 RepID=A0A7M2WX17_9BACT|nr:hypothetical protein [Humisphaera borealis]QOV89949.1 hypothetical protein IPV69_00825 [Humisphaera borealis]